MSKSIVISGETVSVTTRAETVSITTGVESVSVTTREPVSVVAEPHAAIAILETAYLYYDINQETEAHDASISTITDRTSNGRDADTTSPGAAGKIETLMINGSTAKSANFQEAEGLIMPITGNDFAAVDFELYFQIFFLFGNAPPFINFWGGRNTNNNDALGPVLLTDRTLRFQIGNATDGRAFADTVDALEDETFYTLRIKVDWTNDQITIFLNGVEQTLTVNDGDMSALSAGNMNLTDTLGFGQFNDDGTMTDNGTKDRKNILRSAIFTSLLTDVQASEVTDYFSNEY